MTLSLHELLIAAKNFSWTDRPKGGINFEKKKNIGFKHWISPNNRFKTHFLAAMSSSRSDNVTKSVCLSVCLSVCVSVVILSNLELLSKMFHGCYKGVSVSWVSQGCSKGALRRF